MDELVKLVVERTGLPEAQAKQAVETVIGFLKGKSAIAVAREFGGGAGLHQPRQLDLGGESTRGLPVKSPRPGCAAKPGPGQYADPGRPTGD